MNTSILYDQGTMWKCYHDDSGTMIRKEQMPDQGPHWMLWLVVFCYAFAIAGTIYNFFFYVSPFGSVTFFQEVMQRGVMGLGGK
jgi:hypothetical protein